MHYMGQISERFVSHDFNVIWKPEWIERFGLHT